MSPWFLQLGRACQVPRTGNDYSGGAGKKLPAEFGSVFLPIHKSIASEWTFTPNGGHLCKVFVFSESHLKN